MADPRLMETVVAEGLVCWAEAQNLSCALHPGQLRGDPSVMRVRCGSTSCSWGAAPPADVVAAVGAYAKLYLRPPVPEPIPWQPPKGGGISDFGKVCIGAIVALMVFFVAFYVMAEIKTPDSTIDIIGGRDIPDKTEGQ